MSGFRTLDEKHASLFKCINRAAFVECLRIKTTKLSQIHMMISLTEKNTINCTRPQIIKTLIELFFSLFLLYKWVHLMNEHNAHLVHRHKSRQNGLNRMFCIEFECYYN